jgi:hypothetical protein
MTKKLRWHRVIETALAGLLALIGASVMAFALKACEEPSVQLLAVRCEPQMAVPGESVTMLLDVQASDDARRGIGATLFVGPKRETPLYDSDNDKHGVPIVAGKTTLRRTFVVPQTAPPGEAELSGALWKGKPGEEGGADADDSCVLTIETGGGSP